MTDFSVTVDLADDHVATVEFARGDAGFLDAPLMAALAHAVEDVAGRGEARAILLCSAGRHFCAGADFSGDPEALAVTGDVDLYDSAVRLFAQPLPMVAAVQGAAVGGGLGLALACDFRFASAESRFCAPFSRLGIHCGFGLSVTLPRLVGQQHAMDLLYTGRRVGGEEARGIGLCDALVPVDELRSAARAYTARIASAAPIAVTSMRRTLRARLADEVRSATEHERAEQAAHQATEDHAEGVAADLARRPATFLNR